MHVWGVEDGGCWLVGGGGNMDNAPSFVNCGPILPLFLGSLNWAVQFLKKIEVGNGPTPVSKKFPLFPIFSRGERP